MENILLRISISNLACRGLLVCAGLFATSCGGEPGEADGSLTGQLHSCDSFAGWKRSVSPPAVPQTESALVNLGTSVLWVNGDDGFLYDSQRGEWTEVTAPPMPFVEGACLTALLKGTNALLISKDGAVWKSAEFSLDEGSWTTPIETGQTVAMQCTVTKSAGFLAGGRTAATEKVFVYKDGEWSSGPDLAAARRGAGLGRLAGGGVLVVGGFDADDALFAGAELLSDGSSEILDAEFPPRSQSALYPLADGRLAILGGVDENNAALRNADFFNEGAGAFAALEQMKTPKKDPVALPLSDGRVLVLDASAVPSSENSEDAGTAEIYILRTGRWEAAAEMLPWQSQEPIHFVDLGSGAVLALGEENELPRGDLFCPIGTPRL